MKKSDLIDLANRRVAELEDTIETLKNDLKREGDHLFTHPDKVGEARYINRVLKSEYLECSRNQLNFNLSFLRYLLSLPGEVILFQKEAWACEFY